MRLLDLARRRRRAVAGVAFLRRACSGFLGLLHLFVERLLGIGAVQVGDHRGIRGPGSGWVILADPEGNEFCILRSEAELAASVG